MKYESYPAPRSAFQLVAIDLDGTLLNSCHELTALNADAIREMILRRIHVVLASGRQYVAICPWLEKLKLSGLQIACDGAQIVDAQSGHVWFEHRLPAMLARRILEIGTQLGATMVVARDGNTFVSRLNADTEYMMSFGDPAPAVVSSLLSVLAPAPTHIMGIASSDPSRFSALVDEFRRLLDSEVAIRLSSPYYIEFHHPSVNKGMALLKIRRHLNVPKAATLSIGDGQNDIPLFEESGYSVAMSHSAQDVKDVASEVATINESEVAQAIAKLVLDENWNTWHKAKTE